MIWLRDRFYRYQNQFFKKNFLKKKKEVRYENKVGESIARPCRKIETKCALLKKKKKMPLIKSSIYLCRPRSPLGHGTSTWVNANRHLSQFGMRRVSPSYPFKPSPSTLFFPCPSAEMASEVSKVEIAQQQQQQQQPRRHGKGRSSSSSPSSVRDGAAAAAVPAGEVMPEWKLKCLCAEVGVPRIASGGLNMGGCF